MQTGQLPESRLATTDEQGKRIFVHPIDVKGFWSRLRFYTQWFLIFIYLVLPWIVIDGKQIILLNLPKREFYIFGTTFYGHDGPMLLYLLLGFIFMIAFVTSKYGRIWCGYACPQTVFIERLYRFVDKLIEGSARRRQKLELSSWTLSKVLKKSLKWFLFLLISLHVVHSGIGYFVGTRRLLFITTQSPMENLYLFVLMLTLTLIVLIDFGWFREQFCIIACPYGRFQSILMDENSLAVSYDEKRGEPRKRTDPNNEGDCVNCSMCVKACPTGIDIREGLQMECIACTACIDACDEIMEKVHKPLGLIRYTTQNKLQGNKSKTGLRVYIYGFMFFLMGAGLVTHLQIRKGISVQVLRASKTPFQVINIPNQPKRILNHFSLKIHSGGDHPEKLFVKLSDEFRLMGAELIIPDDSINVDRDNTTKNIFIKFPENILVNGELKVLILITSQNKSNLKIVKEVSLVGPIR